VGSHPSRKGTGFAQPLSAHQHWHIDVSYLNIGGTCSASWTVSAGKS
jgi:putative transposase